VLKGLGASVPGESQKGKGGMRKSGDRYGLECVKVHRAAVGTTEGFDRQRQREDGEEGTLVIFFL
jgi:hypothetical protein